MFNDTVTVNQFSILSAKFLTAKKKRGDAKYPKLKEKQEHLDEFATLPFKRILGSLFIRDLSFVEFKTEFHMYCALEINSAGKLVVFY